MVVFSCQPFPPTCYDTAYRETWIVADGLVQLQGNRDVDMGGHGVRTEGVFRTSASAWDQTLSGRALDWLRDRGIEP